MKLIGKTQVEVEKKKSDIDIEQEIEDLLAYLKSTDWYTCRKVQTGKDIPVEIVNRCETARSRISELRSRQSV